MHCHPRKHTALLCLEGEGSVSTRGGGQYAFEPGMVLQFEPGAYHRTTASSRASLRLLEVETPKDKFDLLRIEDDYRNVGSPYEEEDHAPLRLPEDNVALAAQLALQPFVEATDRRRPSGPAARRGIDGPLPLRPRNRRAGPRVDEPHLRNRT